MVINVPISESLNELGEVVVKPRISKEGAVNKMALVGARMLSMEEASRYAGGYSDPARLVTAFAGVAGNSNDNGVCVFKASVGYYENGDPRTLGTGTAYEKESSSFINKTSYIENCETSAVGRALGMAGFGIDTSVASYEEVANAIENQGKKKTKATKEQVNYILENSTQEQIIKIMDKYSIDDISDLDAETATKLVLRINKLKMEATK